ncbi:Maf-like protein [Rhizobium sp. CFBP 8762]|uniref:Maf-like protein n=1 Tax=Rhizobium sp. CFBP 8762 TaxID=2775279 RepID=UPI0017855B2B|nr:Maf-like protein [Rhizobium sp. CFBP 8762]MBD8556758.1 Maf-like protein [Rhizobium sp. CFBP 8762]
MPAPLILGSASPFRKALMENAGLTFTVQSAVIDERSIESNLEAGCHTPEQVALILAEAKALEVSNRFPDALVLGSDQTLSLGDRVFHKPVDRAGAQEHLKALSGKTHQLNSAVVLAQNAKVLWNHISTARLTMRDLSANFIERHLQRVGDTVLSSVGAYQLEGEGLQLFDHIDGDYFTIIGLPMLPLLKQLRTMGQIDA